MVAQYNGEIFYAPPTTMRGQCSSGGGHSYDCSFKLGSWTYDGNMISLREHGTGANGLDTYFVQSHPRWNLTSAVAARNVKHYSCCPEPYHNWQMNLTITDNYIWSETKCEWNQVPVSISDKTSYCKISQSLEAARFVFGIVRSLWHLRRLSGLRSIQHPPRGWVGWQILSSSEYGPGSTHSDHLCYLLLTYQLNMYQPRIP